MTVRVGVIGTGTMGTAHIRTLAEQINGATIVAVSDAEQERAQAATAAIGQGGIRIHREPEELIASSDVDAILIASPDHTHETLVLACLDAGKPVLCEKPLAATVEGCHRVVEHEARIGRRLVQVGFMRRFDPSYVDMKRVLDSGEIGRPLLAHCVHRNATALAWFTSAMPILNSAVHELDIVRWLLSTDIAGVSVFTPRSSGRAAAGMSDPRLLVVETTCGVTVDIEVFVNAQYGYDVRCELVAEAGTISLPPPATTVRRAAGIEGIPIADDFRTRFADAYREQLQAWIRAAATGGADGASAWDGYAASLAAQECLRAAEEHRMITVSTPDKPRIYRTAREEACVTTRSVPQI
jgi:myo-inositol 2-dehydrogenase / D-chiro-inositol 1-dehydrogenase